MSMIVLDGPQAGGSFLGTVKKVGRFLGKANNTLHHIGIARNGLRALNAIPGASAAIASNPYGQALLTGANIAAQKGYGRRRRRRVAGGRRRVHRRRY